MYFNGRKDILEDDDFVSLHDLSLSTEGGRQYVSVKLLLNSARKVYGPDEKPVLLCLSDGVSQRLLSIEPEPAPLPVEQEPEPVAQAEAVQAKAVAAKQAERQAEAQAEVAAELAEAVSAVQASLTATPAPQVKAKPASPYAGEGNESVGIAKGE